MNRTQIVISANTGGKNSISEPMYSVALVQYPDVTGQDGAIYTGQGDSKSAKVIRHLVSKLQFDHKVTDENVIERM